MVVSCENQPPDKIESFSLENFEIIEENGSKIHLNFNREILAEEQIDVTLSLESYKGKSANQNVRIEKTNGGLFVLKVDSIPELNGLVHEHVTGQDSIHFISVTFKSDYGSHPMSLVENGGRFKIYHSIALDIKNYSQDDKIVEKLDRNISESRKWMMNLLRYSEGDFDSNGNKQGVWEWKYYKGNTLAKTEFNNNKITSLLTIFNYNGGIKDSIFYGESGKISEWKSFSPSGMNIWEKKY